MSVTQKVEYLIGHTEGFEVEEVGTALARLRATTPHSAEVERLVSASHLLTSPLRSSLHLDTENEYLYIHFTMTPIEEWDPILAIRLWLTEKERCSKDNPKAHEQVWFRMVFDQAGVEEDTVPQLARIVTATSKK